MVVGFSQIFNGTGRIIKTKCIDIKLYTDASGTGFGGLSSDQQNYFHGIWNSISIPCSHVAPSPRFLSIDESISQKELWPILIACQRYGSTWTGFHVRIYSDNQAVCAMISTGPVKEVNTMNMLREIFWVSFIFNFTLTCKYIPGLDNVHADFLSRLSSFSWSFLEKNLLYYKLLVAEVP